MDLHLFRVGIMLKLHQYTDLPNQYGCRLWIGAKKKSNELYYGMIRVKVPHHRSRTYHSHRVVYMLHVNDFNIASNLDVSHLCGQSLCCNINHLSLETHEVNLQRKICTSLAQSGVWAMLPT